MGLGIKIKIRVKIVFEQWRMPRDRGRAIKYQDR